MTTSLEPHKSRPIEDLAAIRIDSTAPKVRADRKPRIELPASLNSLNWDQVEEILSNNMYLKWQFVELGAERFAISRSKLLRQNRNDVIALIRAALDHERSLDVIERQAHIAGERRSM
ncbi:MAG: hypothetical protein OXI17_12895 [Gammaproteobacteria bacterium]|nr:hypothetical protein [Gammaproteobacteria bacterium]